MPASPIRQSSAELSRVAEGRPRALRRSRAGQAASGRASIPPTRWRALSLAAPRAATRAKILDALDEQSVDFLKRCPFALVGTTAADGTIEVSPKGDEPGFTQPLMYRIIRSHPTTLEIYAKRLVAEGLLTEGEVDKLRGDWRHRLEAEFEAGQCYKPNKADWLDGRWAGLKAAQDILAFETTRSNPIRP